MIGYKVMKRTRMCFERTDRAISIGRSPLCGGVPDNMLHVFFSINAPFGSDYFALISQHNLVGTLLYSHSPPICQGGIYYLAIFPPIQVKGKYFSGGNGYGGKMAL